MTSKTPIIPWATATFSPRGQFYWKWWNYLNFNESSWFLAISANNCTFSLHLLLALSGQFSNPGSALCQVLRSHSGGCETVKFQVLVWKFIYFHAFSTKSAFHHENHEIFTKIIFFATSQNTQLNLWNNLYFGGQKHENA